VPDESLARLGGTADVPPRDCQLDQRLVVKLSELYQTTLSTPTTTK